MSKTTGRFLLIGLPILIIAAFIALFVILGATQPRPERETPVPRPAAVFVAEAVQSPVRLLVSTQGEVSPVTQIGLVAQVSGRIAYVNPSFTQGGFFEEGDVLVRLEDEDYRLAVTRAEALVTQRRQALVREEAEAELAAEEWGAIGEGDASALTLRQPQLADARAQLAGAEASLREARLALARTRITAPFNGRVREKLADLGQYVGPGARIGEIFSTDTAQVRLPFTDSELGRAGIPVAFRADSFETAPVVTLGANLAGAWREWEGRIVRTDSSIDPQTRTLYAIAEVADPFGAAAEAAGAPLAMGLFVEARVPGRSLETAITLPRSALRGADQVLVARPDGTLSVRTVDIVESSPQRLVVASGVEAGEFVVTSPLRGAADGMRIRALDSDGEPIFPGTETIEPAAAEAGESQTANPDANASVASAD
ncbi:RND family efflux transporter MFP subunit [Glycocaulis alkaliphilus]|uniref:RND family efflux transporter MFP subunit n=1 Tax=Glycocaulis alkaliphilus TaxID=1434191 RepID=A0A3T0E6H9_9PROT|nr:efflux RND transporter periplasmic adaptor subunit [Glycocaulis alkaliphilus]AZU03005.1 RND family efflux transporter MFP subunit [Glycocaulis alkaliphilus]GGB70242.1 RND superfamily efflux pump MFP component [Glycocaulis alkaliphilus]